MEALRIQNSKTAHNINTKSRTRIRRSPPTSTIERPKTVTRKSLDIPRTAIKNPVTKRDTKRRKSFDAKAIMEVADTSTHPIHRSEVSKAALIAWNQSQRKNSPSSDISGYNTLTRNVPSQLPKKRYEYNRPTITSSRARLQHLTVTTSSSNTNKPEERVARSKTTHENTNKKKTTKATTSLPSTPVVAKKSFPVNDQTLNDGAIDISPEERVKHVLETLQGVDKAACEQIVNDILVLDEKVYWDDIAGLNSAKNSLKETVVYPFLRPDLFKGLREPVRGILLFGPPGTGKTLIAKAVATESNSTFFSISASSLLSKYLGESEKLVKALFYLSKRLAPSIIFIDEIDSLLTARSENENESSRRIKTEVLIQWSSLSSATTKENINNDNRVLLLAATNLPWAIDDAARRRFSRRIYIPLPEYETRLEHLKKLMARQKNTLTQTDFETISKETAGFSGSDITSLAKEAAMEPIRELGDKLMDIDFEKIRGISRSDFENAMLTCKKSVSNDSLKPYQQWAAQFGSNGS